MRRSSRRPPGPQPPQLAYQGSLLAKSLDELGPRWTLLILRDVAYLRLARFGEILRNNPGLTPRVLSRRLKEMTAAGLIRRSSSTGPRYEATPRGEDAVQVLQAFLRFGLRHHAPAGLGLRDPVGGWHRGPRGDLSGKESRPAVSQR